jgi:hypothetical protein
VTETRYPESLTAELIAPCGMDCGLCIAHLRERKPCPGCNDGDDRRKPNHCSVCAIKRCAEPAMAETGFCHSCAKLPCARMRQLDTRYRTKYGMSMIENLEIVREVGLDAFIEEERVRWTCRGCGAVVCVHRAECIYCGHPRSRTISSG